MKSCRFEIEDPISPKGEEALSNVPRSNSIGETVRAPNKYRSSPGNQIDSDRNREKHPCVFGNFVKLLKSSAPRSAAPSRLRFSSGSGRFHRFCLLLVLLVSACQSSQRDDKLFQLATYAILNLRQFYSYSSYTLPLEGRQPHLFLPYSLLSFISFFSSFCLPLSFSFLVHFPGPLVTEEDISFHSLITGEEFA